MGGVAAIDNTGIGMLFEVYRMLGKKMIQMAITNPRGQVVEKLMAAGFIDVVGKEWIFLSIQDAVSGCNFALEEGNKRNGKQEHA
ncbi:probable sulfate transporter 3.5 [Dendrobium catenatum]|uniref:probable sulfate transporter 3.5 n=1 Tax=Dendrobium catenatum TaxID=906689 RepID=UPI0009F326A1|nr:probable sulfate transporter 3.5 [Dendrobium catenatum]